MKKVLLLSICSFFLLGALSAQTFGVRGGLNLANLTGDGDDDNKMKIGVEVGPMVEFNLTETIDLNVSALYSLKGSKAETIIGDFEAKNNYIEIPVLAHIGLGDSGFFAEAGPYLGLLLSADVEDVDVKDSYKSTDFGLRLGLGYDFGGIRANAHFGLGLSNISENEDVDIKNQVIHVGLAYLFGE